MSMRIGLYGGSFNPVHLGHLLLADCALEAFGLDQVWFLPCHRPAHKPSAGLEPAVHRIRMLRLAVRGDRRFRISMCEIRRGGVSYAVDTVRSLRAAHPGHEWTFLVGMDSLPELHRWHEISSLLRLCEFGIFERPGFSRPRAEDLAELEPRIAHRLVTRVVRGRFLEVSSREIRERIAAGREIRYIVPSAVGDYIRLNGLYGGRPSEQECAVSKRNKSQCGPRKP